MANSEPVVRVMPDFDKNRSSMTREHLDRKTERCSVKRVHVAVGLGLTVMFLFCAMSSHAQQTVATATDAAAQAAVNNIVPPLINFSGVLTDAGGKPLTDVARVIFSLYEEQQGGGPLWMETQNVQPDATGHYSVMLGAATTAGLPSSLFATGEAHWLGVQVQGQAE
jgi:hypothetical protein